MYGTKCTIPKVVDENWDAWLQYCMMRGRDPVKASQEKKAVQQFQKMQEAE